MTHGEAQREMSVEKYLLDELQGNARDEFEDHLFDCALCAADLQAGADLAEGIRITGPQLVTTPSARVSNRPALAPWGQRASTWAASLWAPWFAAPALAACLAIIAVQSFVIQPRLHREIAQAQEPTLVSADLTLKGGVTRGSAMSEVVARSGSGFLLSVEIPGDSRFREYRCTLVSPDGRPVWHAYFTPAQVTETVVIHVPVGSTASGVNVFKVEGIPQSNGGPAVALFERSFTLKIGE